MPRALTYKEVKQFIEIESNSGCRLLSTEYKNSNTKLEIQCSCGEVFYRRFNNFNSGNQRLCTKCSKEVQINKRRSPYEEVKKYIEVISQSGCVLLSTEYVNTKTPLIIRCRCGEVFKTTLECFKLDKKNKCDYCSGKKVRNKVCPICECEFKPIKKKQVCCSKKCAQILRNPPIYVECEICKKEFRKSKNQIDRCTHNYCSNECRAKGVGIHQSGENNPNYKGKSYLGQCSNCGEEMLITDYEKRFEKKYRYCSLKCKGEHQKEILKGENNPKYRSIECSCAFCGEILYRTPTYINSRINIYCSKECKADWQSRYLRGENNPKYDKSISKEEREIGRNFDGYAYWRREVYKRDKYTCQCCGYDGGGNIQAHHLDGYNWAIDKRTEINNGITLCEVCHKEFHSEYGNGNNTKEQFKEFLENRN